MLGKIKVVSNEDFEKWLGSDGPIGGTLADKGRALFGSKACVGCHSLDGKKGVGPTFKGLFGSKEKTNKGEVTVDENFLRESILNPNEKVTDGYPAGVMPPFAGQLNDDEVNALIEFIKTAK
jgi:cytochrome c oxidase subunit 2